MAVFGVLRDPKKGTFGNRNFSKRLILQSVGQNEQMDAVSYSFGHFKAVFQVLAVFGFLVKPLVMAIWAIYGHFGQDLHSAVARECSSDSGY